MVMMAHSYGSGVNVAIKSSPDIYMHLVWYFTKIGNYARFVLVLIDHSC